VTRQKKSPRQRAEEALAVADRKVKKLTADVAKHRAALDAASTERNQAVTRRDYPDLTPPTTTQEKTP
jgi:hypothetical protein